MGIVAGVDEAGRGSVIGPLVVSAVAVDARKIPLLEQIGVKDSKLLNAKARDMLYNKIIGIADKYAVCIAEPNVIDAYVSKGMLNMLEAKMFADAIAKINPALAYVDACDVNPARFAERVATLLNNSIMLSASHKADARNVVVGAASIIAKVARDDYIKRLKERYGDFGSGYPSDSKTMRFIAYTLNKGIRLECIRYSWKPVKRMLAVQNSFYYLPLYY